MADSMGVHKLPIFPPELERIIFELAVRTDRKRSWRVALVARRVWEWIKPIHHEIFYKDTEDEYLQARTVGKYIRHLLIPIRVDYMRDFSLHITNCPNLEDLAIWIGKIDDCPDIAGLLSALPLRRLSMTLGGIFDGRRPISLFPNLTHLEILDDLSESWSCISNISLLPNLTHLAYNGNTPSWDIVTNSLLHCKELRVLIIHDADDDDPDESGRILPEGEFRVVMGIEQVDNWNHDWFTGAAGGEDFWIRAERVVEERRQAAVETGA